MAELEMYKQEILRFRMILDGTVLGVSGNVIWSLKNSLTMNLLMRG